MVETALTPGARMRTRLIGALVRYLALPTRHHRPQATVDPQSLGAILARGDVLLTGGTTRIAALVKLVTRSTWSHVSMYVGPLEEGPDPRCIVEADIAAGVRSIRLSELQAVHVRVLRPVGVSDVRRRLLADWVAGRIGSEYDLEQAWGLGRRLLRLKSPADWRAGPRRRLDGDTRFFCCSLLARAFALVGNPLLPTHTRVGRLAVIDYSDLTPADFELAPTLKVVYPIDNASEARNSLLLRALRADSGASLVP